MSEDERPPDDAAAEGGAKHSTGTARMTGSASLRAQGVVTVTMSVHREVAGEQPAPSGTLTATRVDPDALVSLCLVKRQRGSGAERASDSWGFERGPGGDDRQPLSASVVAQDGELLQLTPAAHLQVIAGVRVSKWRLTAATPILFRELKRILGEPIPLGVELVPPTPGAVRERPAEFDPPAITLLSDPHTQAATRGMWAPQEWKRPADGTPYYTDKNGVMVYAKDAGDIILGLDDAKANTLLICLGKWFAETSGDLARPEAARVYVEDILAFRGIKKHPHGGYELKQKEATKADILFLRDLWVRSHQRIWETTRRGRRQLVDVDVDDPLVVVSLESTVDLWGERTPYAFRFRPGPWARHYLGGPQHWTTAVLKRIMGYHPFNDRLKMRLGIYLTFQWRIRANRGTWEQPWRLKTLLDGAKIEIPKKDPQRFFPRVLKALEELHADGILAVYEALDFPDWRPPPGEPPKRWVPRLLDGRWRLLPAAEVRDRLPRPPVEAPA